VQAWHPLQERVEAGTTARVAEWRDSPSFEPQEFEEKSFARIALSDVGASLGLARETEPGRVERFFVELRQQYNRVRGTRLEGEYAKSLPALETNLPADLWQHHFGDIDPTPVDLAVSAVKVLPLEPAEGDMVSVSVIVANQGSGASVGFMVRLYVDGAPVKATTLPGLAAGASSAVSFPWVATGGIHQLQVVADSQHRILEPDESDNAAERLLLVRERP